eukprot:jgi/Tetstr1/449003/TSEL_036228.t1
MAAAAASVAGRMVSGRASARGGSDTACRPGGPCRRVAAPPASGHRRGVVRRAAWQGYKGPPGPVDISKLQGFTPAQLLSYAAELTRHSAALTVAAAPQACFDAWQDRANHQHFLTLAQQIGWDNGPEELDAIYEFYYRWGRMPAVQMVCELERTEVVAGQRIRFRNKGDPETFGPDDSELPLEGCVEFEPKGDGTLVTLTVGYGMPNVFIDYVGEDTVAFNIETIIEDNLERFKALVEGGGAMSP